MTMAFSSQVGILMVISVAIGSLPSVRVEPQISQIFAD